MSKADNIARINTIAETLKGLNKEISAKDDGFEVSYDDNDYINSLPENINKDQVTAIRDYDNVYGAAVTITGMRLAHEKYLTNDKEERPLKFSADMLGGKQLTGRIGKSAVHHNPAAPGENVTVQLPVSIHIKGGEGNTTSGILKSVIKATRTDLLGEK